MPRMSVRPGMEKFASWSAPCALLVALGCSKAPKDESQPTATPSGAAATPVNSSAAPSAALAGPRATLSWAELHGSKALEGMSARQGKAPSPEAAKVEPPQVRFTRVAGGTDFYCGTLKSGPVRCWGKRSDLEMGGFVDVAIAGDAVCGVISGSVTCLGGGKAPALSDIKRIVASGDTFCALAKTGTVSCWTPGGPTLQAPEGLEAKYMVVGSGFACAADKAGKLACWGSVEALALPSEALKIDDLAAGDEFVCTLVEKGAVKCFGKAPELPQGTYKSISASKSSLCAVAEGGKARCVGAVVAEWDAATKVSVGDRSACAFLPDGSLDCRGSEENTQLLVPRESSPAADSVGLSARAMKPEDFQAFLQQFPDSSLPVAFDRAASISLGDRISRRFDDLIGGNAEDYRAGVRLRLPNGAVAVTVLEAETGRLELRIFSADGKPTKARTLASYKLDPVPPIEADDGTRTQKKTIATLESRVTAEGLVSSTSTEGSSNVHYSKERRDGSRDVSHVECRIQATEWTDEITDKGELKRKDAKVQPARSSTDQKGCDDQWPFTG